MGGLTRRNKFFPLCTLFIFSYILIRGFTKRLLRTRFEEINTKGCCTNFPFQYATKKSDEQFQRPRVIQYLLRFWKFRILLAVIVRMSPLGCRFPYLWIFLKRMSYFLIFDFITLGVPLHVFYWLFRTIFQLIVGCWCIRSSVFIDVDNVKPLSFWSYT